MPTQAVIFDMDGVIVETEHVWDEAREELVREVGGRWLADSATAMMGMASFEWSAYMRDELRVPLTAEQINTRVVLKLKDRYTEQLPLIDGATELVMSAADRWPTAIASSSDRALIDLVTALAGIDAALNTTVSSEEAGRGKPAPDVFLLAAEQLGVPAAKCVVVEDSANGIRAALAAGMRVIAAPNRDFPPPPEVLAAAAITVDHVSSITLELLERAGE